MLTRKHIQAAGLFKGDYAASPTSAALMLAMLGKSMPGVEFREPTTEEMQKQRMDAINPVEAAGQGEGMSASLSESMEAARREEEVAREAARPATADYTGDPCQFCGRIRVYLRVDGQLICEKCERFQDA